MKNVLTFLFIFVALIGVAQKTKDKTPAKPAVVQADTLEANIVMKDWRIQELALIDQQSAVLNAKLIDLIAGQARDEKVAITRDNLIGLRREKDGSFTVLIKKE